MGRATRHRRELEVPEPSSYRVDPSAWVDDHPFIDLSTAHIFSLAASAVFLALAALAALRGTRNPLAVPTAILCVDLFAYTGLDVLGGYSSERHWEWLESMAAALAAPLLVSLTARFLGVVRSQRPFVLGAWFYFGAVATICLFPFVWSKADAFPGGSGWAVAMGLGLLPTMIWSGRLLWLHYSGSVDTTERARTQLFALTIFVGMGGSLTDLAQIAGAIGTPQLAAVTMLMSALLLTALSLQVRLLRGAAGTLVVSASLIGFVGIALEVWLFQRAGSQTTVFLVGTIAVALLITAVARSIASAYLEDRARNERLVTLGRLAAQMAHDVRNPLAAIRGAAQYIDEERKRGGSLEEQEAFVRLILDQVDRLENVVQRANRLGRADAEPIPVNVRSVLEPVVQGVQVRDEVVDGTAKVELDVASAVGDWPLDEGLVATALENLILNALEALDESGGRVVVKAVMDNEPDRQALVLSVADDGQGMDPRTRAAATRPFFTTKTQGTGLGLAFARRVASAHGGKFDVQSALGHGTKITMTFPAPKA